MQGAGKMLLAAAKLQRNSIGIEIEPQYCALAEQRLERELKTLFGDTQFEFVSPVQISKTADVG